MLGSNMRQRKFRDTAERDAVCRTVVDEAVRAGLALDSEPMTELFEAFAAYTNATHGGTMSGVIPADEIRPGAVLEFLLPGRRVLRPMVRLTTKRSSSPPPPPPQPPQQPPQAASADDDDDDDVPLLV